MENPITVSLIGIVITTLVSLWLGTVNRSGTSDDLFEKIKKLKLEKLEQSAKTYAGFGNHTIKQVDLVSSERNWRGIDEGESDYAYEFSRSNIETTLFIIRLEALKRRTNLLNKVSDAIIAIAIINIAITISIYIPDTKEYLPFLTPALPISISIAILLTAIMHLFAHRSNAAKIKTLDQA